MYTFCLYSGPKTSNKFSINFTRGLNNHKNTERLRTFSNVTFLIKCQNQKLKHIKQVDNNCHIPDLEHTFSYVENGGLNLVL